MKRLFIIFIGLFAIAPAFADFAITYNLNSGTNDANNPTSYNTEDDDIILNNPTRVADQYGTEYIFGGWCEDSELTTNCEYNKTIASGSTGDKEYWAKWVVAEFKLSITKTDSFFSRISASGTFYIDCGDGGTLSGSGVDGKKITRTGVSPANYTCNWDDATITHKIRFGGKATGYNTSYAASAIRFIGIDGRNFTPTDAQKVNPEKITGMSGSLGQIFGTVSNPPSGQISQPCFPYTFAYAKSITSSIPPNLFKGVHGTPRDFMFESTFLYCTRLTGSIPETLFCSNPDNPNASNCIYGAPTTGIFSSTFNDCDYLTNTNIPDPNNAGLYYAIPPKLFVGMRGVPKYIAFNRTFQGCGNINGSIPPELFSGISGAPEKGVFQRTFAWGSYNGFKGKIPIKLFQKIKGTSAAQAFADMFYDSHGLTGFTDGTNATNYIPATFLSSVFPGTAKNQANNMFYGTGLLSSCPEGMTNVTRSIFSGAGKPWCAPTCPAGSYNAKNTDACYPHILHVGSYNVYLKPVTENTPSPALRVKIGNDEFYANMTQTQTYLNNNSPNYLRIKYNNKNYYVCDETMCNQE